MALQNLINVGVMATDVIMLGKVGETVLSGASLGGQIYFILSLILFGTTSGACVLLAQYWGKQDIDSIEKVIGIAMKISITISVIFMVVSLLIPESLMRIYSNEPAVILEGSKYVQIIALTYPIVAFTLVYLNLMKSVERVIISTLVYGVSLIVNVIANAILIFGLFGVPAMGIKGAAIGTLIARLTELLIVVIYAAKFNRQVKVRLHYCLHMDKILFPDFMRYSGPVILNEMMWGLGYSANSAIVGHMGSSAVAANSVSQVARQLATVIVFGIANATAIMIGKAIGEKKDKVAEAYGASFIRLALVFGIIGGMLILFLRPIIISALGFSGQTAEYMNAFMFMMSFYVVVQAVNTTCIVGIFRAGGDTKFGLIIDVASMWGASILLGAIAAFVFHWPVEIVYAILLLDEVIKTPLTLLRYRKKIWLKNVTRDCQTVSMGND
ncbi:MAG: MATE family efflux transporter [Lachnospiraceae bacterium]